MNGDGYLNIPADEMKFDGTYISVYMKGSLVALLDVGVVLCAHMSEKEVTK